MKINNYMHKIPKDLNQILLSDPKILNLWNSLTPLSKNEWICWVTIVKKIETRKKHLKQMCDDMTKGKRRPCCWAGCPHRRPYAQK